MENLFASTEEAVRHVQDHFPCSKAIVNIQSDVQQQIQSQKPIPCFANPTTKELNADICELRKAHRMLGKA